MSLPWICRSCRTALNKRHISKPRASSTRYISSDSKYFKVSEEIRQAISEGRPVVALESTIYTHGFPYPENLDLATKLESLVRRNGGVPATIGILNGIARVGLHPDELTRLVSASGPKKVSRRDFGFVLGLKDANGKALNGGTTVSGTMVLAHMAGIRVFGTGGLGGVHRGAEQTMDVSADLTELGRTPVAVISSGCKSFLDIPKTLEYLETQGVSVATFADGRTGAVDFPAFYTRDSGVRSPVVLQNEEDAARVILAQTALGLQSGLVFSNPIPEKHSIPFELMEQSINQALTAAHQAGSTGAAATPFILDKIKEITGSKSVEANTALVESNVVRAAKVAVALRKLESEGSTGSDGLESISLGNITGPAASNYTSSGVTKGLQTHGGAAAEIADPHDRLAAIRDQSKSIFDDASKESLQDESSISAVSISPEELEKIVVMQDEGRSLDEIAEAFPNKSKKLLTGMLKNMSMAAASGKFPSTKVKTTAPAVSVEAPSSSERADVFVAGSLAVDLACDFNPRSESGLSTPELQTSNPAMIAQSLGGVGHNVARAAYLMGANVRLCSAVGDDLTGKAALEALSTAGMSTTGVKTLPQESGSRTAQYVAINDTKKDLVLAMADMSILETPSSTNSTISETFETFWLPQLHAAKPSHIAIDGNWPPEYLARWLSAASSISAHVTFEPVSKVKSAGIFQLPKPSSKGHTLSVFPNPSIHLSTPNIHELSAMYTAARSGGAFDRQDWWSIIDALGIPHSGARTQMSLATTPELVDQGIPQQSIQLLPFIPTICTKLGRDGVLLTQLLPAGDARLTSGDYAPYILSRNPSEGEDGDIVGGVYMRLFPCVEDVKPEDIVSVNGVGDTFAGTLLAGLAKGGKKEARVEDLIDVAQRAAVLTLKSKEAVSPGLGTLRMLL